MPEASPGDTVFGLPLAACDRIIAVLHDYPEILQATIFGSRAKGNYRPGSDIDLCLDAPGLTMRRRLELENRLDDLLLPWKIDLVVRDEIDNPALLEHIARVGLELFASLVR
jgi:predicted nucleotidyltransferase